METLTPEPKDACGSQGRQFNINIHHTRIRSVLLVKILWGAEGEAEQSSPFSEPVSDGVRNKEDDSASET